MATIESFKTISDVETIKVIADERRLAILEELQKPKTVKELAERLNSPASQLYYHVNQLEKHGLIQVVSTQVISGIIEKHYQVTARVFRLRNPMTMGDAITPEESSALFAGLLDETKLELQRAFRVFSPPPNNQTPLDPFLTKKEVLLTEEQLREFHARLAELVKECDRLNQINAESDATIFGLTMAFYRAVEDGGEK